jgi:LEM3 (ligand-effect modulator 3) family / CDC50 family
MPANRINKYFKTPDNTSAYVPTPARWKRETNQSVRYPNGMIVSDTNICTLQFSIDNDLKPPVLFYYRLTNFFQNHRRYVKSFDADQLKGVARTADQIGQSDCDPLRTDNVTKLPYYPCGLIANSIFNDTFQEPVKQNPGSNENTTYAMPNTGISWSSDKDLYKKTAYNGSQIVPPPNWVRRYPNYTDFEPPNLSLDEGFQVWMRTAGLPAFSKLARRNDKDVMPRGTYELVIWDGTFDKHDMDGARTKTAIYRVQRHALRRHQVRPHLYPHRHGRKKSFPRYRLYRCWRPLYPLGGTLHRDPHHQAQVSPFHPPKKSTTHP